MRDERNKCPANLKATVATDVAVARTGRHLCETVTDEATSWNDVKELALTLSQGDASAERPYERSRGPPRSTRLVGTK